MASAWNAPKRRSRLKVIGVNIEPEESVDCRLDFVQLLREAVHH